MMYVAVPAAQHTLSCFGQHCFGLHLHETSTEHSMYAVWA